MILKVLASEMILDLGVITDIIMVSNSGIIFTSEPDIKSRFVAVGDVNRIDFCTYIFRCSGNTYGRVWIAAV